MKAILIVAASITAFTGLSAGNAPTPEPDIAGAVVNAKIQEFSHALAALKLREVELSQAIPVDREKLSIVLAQEEAMNQELLHLAVGPLEARLQEALKVYQENHHVVVELREEIRKKTIAITGADPGK